MPCVPFSRRTPSRACSASRVATATAATTTSSNGCCRPRSSRAASRCVSNSDTSSSRATEPTACSASAAAAASSAVSGRRSRTRERPEHPGRTALREELVAKCGELVSVDIEGVRGKRFVLAEEVELLEAPPDPPPSVAFLSPFDPLVWDRALLGSLFAFDYVWELFTPTGQAPLGLVRAARCSSATRLVGRIEPRIDRARGEVEVLGLWWEDGFEPPSRRGLRRRDARRAPRLPALRGREASRVGTAPRVGRDDSSAPAPEFDREDPVVERQSNAKSGGRSTTTVAAKSAKTGR